MSEQPSSPATSDDAPTSAWSPPPTSPEAADDAPTSAWSPPPTSPEAADEASLADRPEVKIGGAFVGGFALALLLRRLAG